MAIRKGNAAKETKGNEPSFNLIEDCGKIADRNNGWELRLRYGSWNGNDEKYDLRAWKADDEGNEKCLKGISLSGEELKSLYNILKTMVEDEPKKGKGKTK